MAGSPKKRARKAGANIPPDGSSNPSRKLAPEVSPEVQAQLDAMDNAQLTPSERIALFGEDAIIDWIGDAHSLLGIAETLGVPRTTLYDWLHSRPDRSARASKAQAMAAHAYAERAELVLEQAVTELDIKAAVPLAVQYRWRAKVLNPESYGDKPAPLLPIDGMAALIDAVTQHREVAKLRAIPADVVDVESHEVKPVNGHRILR